MGQLLDYCHEEDNQKIQKHSEHLRSRSMVKPQNQKKGASYRNHAEHTSISQRLTKEGFEIMAKADEFLSKNKCKPD